jgi:hypothetical protein
MSLNLSKSVVDYLRAHSDEKFTAREIAEWTLQAFPDECQAKLQNSQSLQTEADLIQQIVAEIGSQRPKMQEKNPELKVTADRPRKYYYSDQSDAAEVAAAEAIPSQQASAGQSPPGEHELYPKLVSFLLGQLKIYSMRIDEKTSSNKNGPNGNHWLHPDLVGLQDLGADWDPAVRDCVKHYFDKRTALWSFEVKVIVNRSNVRMSFFQAVSNSSWANLGYLVAAEVSDDSLAELRMLSAAHGIGVIALNKDDPAESDILIPAREQKAIDWDSANRLAKENKDFMRYLKLVKQVYQTGENRPQDWDAPSPPGASSV